MKFRKSLAFVLALLLTIAFVFTGCNPKEIYYNGTEDATVNKETVESIEEESGTTATEGESELSGATIADVKEYTGKPYAVLYNNQPNFKKSEITEEGYEFYSPLDSLGRCGYAMACVGPETMPTQPRGSISSIKPTGWVQQYYPDVISGGYLYNRCHLIAYQLTGENKNKENLITGTRYLNADGMIPFEDMIADHVNETGNHVMYRVTPIFEGNNLLASGVQLEAFSVEDNGDAICFNVYLYNVQPGVVIDYATGANHLEMPPVEEDGNDTPSGNLPSGGNDVGDSENVGGGDNGGDDVGGNDPTPTPNPTPTPTPTPEPEPEPDTEPTNKYVLNTNTKKIHYPDCSSAAKISEKNRAEYEGAISDLINNQGYTTCGNCRPQ